MGSNPPADAQPSCRRSINNPLSAAFPTGLFVNLTPRAKSRDQAVISCLICLSKNYKLPGNRISSRLLSQIPGLMQRRAASFRSCSFRVYIEFYID
jgi:hypothetical protein